MKDPRLWFSPSGGQTVNENALKAMSIRHSIYDPVSTASVTVMDNGGTLFSEFVLAYGSFFDFVVVDYASDDAGLTENASLKSDPHTSEGFDPNSYMRAHPFSLTGVASDSSKEIRSIQGDVTLTFHHPWHVYRDVQNHAFAPMRHDDLVKKVISEGVRGYPLPEPISSNFDKTDDEARLSRYKCQKSDLEFLLEDVLPITSIGYDAPYFFVDYWGDYHLKSFTKMINQPPRIFFGPKVSDLDNDKTRTKVTEYLNNNGIGGDGYVSTQERSVVVYAPQKADLFNAELKPAFVVEDQNVGKTFALGSRDPGTRMPGSTGIYYPMTTLSRQMQNGTSVKVGKNRLLGDSLSSVFGDGRVLNECFSMEVTTPFTGQYGMPGLTAVVYVEKVDYVNLETHEHYDADHWAEGVWLIAATEHYMTPNDHAVYTKTTLIRPNLVVKQKDKSSVAILDALWTME